MHAQTRAGASAIALAALVLIWNEAPIADSPSNHEVDPRVAYSDRLGRSQVEGAPGAQPEKGIGPAARPAKPGDAPGTSADGDRTGVGPKAEPGTSAGGAPSVPH